MNNDELMHYGVLGIKWGKRKASYSNAGTVIKRLTNPTTRIKKDGYQKSRNPIATTISKDGYKKQKKPSGTRSYKAEKTAYKQAKTERKKALNKTYKEINEKTSFGEKLLFNSATRKKAAKYVVDSNMSMKEARKKANKQALRNTAALIGAYGGITVAALYKMNGGKSIE